MCRFHMYVEPGRQEDEPLTTAQPDAQDACPLSPEEDGAVFYDLVVELVASGADWP